MSLRDKPLRLRSELLLHLEDDVKITLMIWSLRKGLKQIIHLKIESKATAIVSLDDLWLVTMNTFLPGYPDNKGSSLHLLTKWNLYWMVLLELLFPNRCCLHLVLVALNHSTCLQEITMSATSVKVQQQCHTSPPARLREEFQEGLVDGITDKSLCCFQVGWTILFIWQWGHRNNICERWSLIPRGQAVLNYDYFHCQSICQLFSLWMD